MTTRTTLRIMPLLALGFIAAMLYACAHNPSLASRHPVQEEDTSLCTNCHGDWRSALSHAADFNIRHRFYAYQQQRTCAMCHSESFCSDCHAHKEELKPSDKHKELVTRDMPHRGDYLSRHQIDGRVNPVSCIRCHGRQNNERCSVCHR